MSTKARLTQLAEEVKRAGMAGHSMNKKMAELVSQHDLSGHEIDRIAEIANRDVQLALYKTAADKRFKFELIDPAPHKAAAKKAALSSINIGPTHAQKVAAVVTEEGGDPFVAPYRGEPVLSLYEQPMNMKTAAEMDVHEIRKTALALDKTRAEIQLILNQGQGEELKVAGQAETTFNKTVQAAVDLLIGGITLPSLYTAVAAAFGGNMATDEQRADADKLMSLVINAVKERGVPNHRLGFRHRGNVELLDSLSSSDLLALCKRSTGRINEQDIPMPLVKVATYLEATHDHEDGVGARLNPAQGSISQPYLDEKYVDNLPGGKPLVINGSNEFVIGVQDLIGDQSRMRRCHAANEYIGLKLKQIETTLRGLRAAQKTAEEKAAGITPPVAPPIPKVAAPPPAMGAPASPPSAGLMTRGLNALGSTKATNAIGLAGIGASLLPYVVQPKAPENPEDRMNRRMKRANAKIEIDRESKEAVGPLVAAIPAIAGGIGAIAGLASTAASVKSMASSPKPAGSAQPTPKAQLV